MSDCPTCHRPLPEPRPLRDASPSDFLAARAVRAVLNELVGQEVLRSRRDDEPSSRGAVVSIPQPSSIDRDIVDGLDPTAIEHRSRRPPRRAARRASACLDPTAIEHRSRREVDPRDGKEQQGLDPTVIEHRSRLTLDRSLHGAGYMSRSHSHRASIATGRGQDGAARRGDRLDPTAIEHRSRRPGSRGSKPTKARWSRSHSHRASIATRQASKATVNAALSRSHSHRASIATSPWRADDPVFGHASRSHSHRASIATWGQDHVARTADGKRLDPTVIEHQSRPRERGDRRSVQIVSIPQPSSIDRDASGERLLQVTI